MMNEFLMFTPFYVKFSSSVYDGHVCYLMFDLCCELAMMLMLKSILQDENHIVMCVSECMSS